MEFWYGERDDDEVERREGAIDIVVFCVEDLLFLKIQFVNRVLCFKES